MAQAHNTQIPSPTEGQIGANYQCVRNWLSVRGNGQLIRTNIPALREADSRWRAGNARFDVLVCGQLNFLMEVRVLEVVTV